VSVLRRGFLLPIDTYIESLDVLFQVSEIRLLVDVSESH